MPGYGDGAYGAGAYGTGATVSKRLQWGMGDLTRYQNGVDRGVLYPMTGQAVVWNGLVSVAESGEAVPPEALYFNGVKYFDLESTPDFKATVSCLTTPPELELTLGIVPVVPGFFLTNQPRSRFNFAYRSGVNEKDYKLHLVYNAIASRGTRSTVTLSDSTDVDAISYEISTIPVEGTPAETGMTSLYRQTSHFVVESVKTSPSRLSALTDILYGVQNPFQSSTPRMPTPKELTDLFSPDWVPDPV